VGLFYTLFASFSVVPKIPPVELTAISDFYTCFLSQWIYTNQLKLLIQFSQHVYLTGFSRTGCLFVALLWGRLLAGCRYLMSFSNCLPVHAAKAVTSVIALAIRRTHQLPVVYVRQICADRFVSHWKHLPDYLLETIRFVSRSPTMADSS